MEDLFGSGSVPIAVVAKVYGKDECWVRMGIVAGWLPIGTATRNGMQLTDISQLGIRQGRTNFYVSPKKLYEETGYIWKGRNNEHKN